MPRSFCPTPLFVIADSPFRFAAILPQPEPSEGHPFVFIDFRTFGSQKDLNTFILNRLLTLCAKITGWYSSALIIRHSLFSHAKNKSCICHDYAKWRVPRSR